MPWNFTETSRHVRTTDGTEPTCNSLKLPQSCVADVVAIVSAQSSSGDVKVWHVMGAFKRVGMGLPALVGTVSNVVGPKGDVGATSWLVTLDASGDEVRVRVTGVLATTIDWAASIAADVRQF